MRLSLAYACLPTLLLGLDTAAAGSGALGPTSSATVRVGLTIGSTMRVSGLDGLALAGVHTAKSTGCIFTNVAPGAFSVQFASKHAQGPGSFRLSDGHGDFVPYEFRWTREASASCEGRQAVQLSATPQHASVGYHDVVTILVAPR